MKETLIATRYAKALFDLAREQDLLEPISADMMLVEAICRKNRDFRLLLASPVIHNDKKESIFREIFKNRIHRLSMEFLMVIVRKNRESYLDLIAAQFQEYTKDFKGIKTVRLITATKPDAETRASLVTLIKKHTRSEIELIEEVSKEVMGGFVIHYDDKQLDASIRNQIEQMKRQFDINPYIREF